MLPLILLCISMLSVESGQNAPYLSIAYEKSGFDSLNMTFVGNWPFGTTECVAIDFTRSVVFLGSGGGIIMLNMQDPSNPQKIGEIRTRGYVAGLFYTDQKLFVACGDGGLEIWDLTNLTQPVKLGFSFTPGYPRKVYVNGTCAYIADSWGGLRIIDVSNPTPGTGVL